MIEIFFKIRFESSGQKKWKKLLYAVLEKFWLGIKIKFEVKCNNPRGPRMTFRKL